MFVIGWSRVEMRIMPYPPSFSRMAAKTIDPAIGASTWALGSHRWKPYNGIFTINAIMHASHKMLLDQVKGKLDGWYVETIKFKDP